MHATYLDLISGHRRGPAAACARGVLALCAPLYGLGVRWRNRCFDDPANTHAAGVPVISVGNLTTGGTGKTPVVAWIVNHLRDTGRRPAILSRGYKSLDGQANDEKLLLDRLCPSVPHIQNPDRVAGAREAVEHHGSNTLVLDDGFQHRRLRRDTDIVLIDALNPWGYGQLLPRGLLREPKHSLRRASLILITRANQLVPPPPAIQRGEAPRGYPGGGPNVNLFLPPPAPAGRGGTLWVQRGANVSVLDLQREIARHTSAPILTTEFHPASLVDATGNTAPLSDLHTQPVLPFCGIGNPEGFRRTLASLDPQLASSNLLTFPDHHHYADSDLAHIAAHARTAGANLLLTTEKDLVKLPPTIDDLPIRALRIGLHFTTGADTLLTQIDHSIHHRAAA